MSYPTQQAMRIHVQPVFYQALEHSSTHAINHDQAQQTTELPRNKKKKKMKLKVAFLDYENCELPNIETKEVKPPVNGSLAIPIQLIGKWTISKHWWYDKSAKQHNSWKWIVAGQFRWLNLKTHHTDFNCSRRHPSAPSPELACSAPSAEDPQMWWNCLRC